VPDFRLLEIEDGTTMSVLGWNSEAHEVRLDGIDEIICATGQRPDYALASELRLKLDPWLESTEALGPLIDPNVHSCGTVRPHGHRELSHPEPGFYTVGVKSYGRAPTFLMATGYEQVRSIAAALAGDFAAADEVQLDLPETGVCSTSFTTSDNSAEEVAAESACCGTPKPRVKASSCCTASAPQSASAGGSCCGTVHPTEVTAGCSAAASTCGR
jgi:hypothetical protein